MKFRHDDELEILLKADAAHVTASDELKVKTIKLLENETPTAQPVFHSRPRRILLTAVIALLSCVMLVSAGTLIINRLVYVPGRGFFEDGDIELYATPSALDFGITTIESAIRSKVTDPETGETSSTLTVYVTGVKPRGMHIILTDGRVINFEEQSFMDKLFVCENFPDENLFTLSVGYKHVNVTLEEVDQTKYANMQWPTDNGITFKALPLNETRTIYAVNTIMNESFYTDVFGKDLAKLVTDTHHYVSRFTFLDADGNVYSAAQNGSSDNTDDGDPLSGYTRIVYADTGENKDVGITEISAAKIDADINFVRWYGELSSSVPTVELPVPKDGETVECDVPLITVDRDTYYITSVTRNDTHETMPNFLFEVRIKDNESKYDLDIYYFRLKCTELANYLNSGGAYHNSDTGEMTLNVGGVKKKQVEEYRDILTQYEGGTLHFGVYGMRINMNGNWTIDYAAQTNEAEAVRFESEVTADED